MVELNGGCSLESVSRLGCLRLTRVKVTSGRSDGGKREGARRRRRRRGSIGRGGSGKKEKVSRGTRQSVGEMIKRKKGAEK